MTTEATPGALGSNDQLGLVPKLAPTPRAWLHTVRVCNGDPGELDQALSFAPDSFPLGDAGLFESISAVPLYDKTAIDAAVAAERERCALKPRGPQDATECATSMLKLADWSAAPLRTEWGAGMMVADVMLTKDETLTAYVHRNVLQA